MLTSHEIQGRDDPESSQPLIWSGARSPTVQEKKYGLQRSRLVSRYTKKSIVVLVLGALGAAAYRIIFSNSEHSALETNWPEPGGSGGAKDEVSLASSNYLVSGNATLIAQENLLPSRKYISCFPSSGWTNQVMEVTTLIYLATLTNRIPVVPSFEPSHFGTQNTAEPLKFGDVFDVPYLASKLGFPVIQWHELKDLEASTEGQALEQLGCWSVRAGNQASLGFPGDWTSRSMFKLDVSYTPIPESFTLTHGADPSTRTWSLWALASLSYPETRERVLGRMSHATIPVPGGSGEKLEPSDHLLCFDDLYYTGIIETNPADDFLSDYSPMWNQVGVHMRWKQSLVDLANQYLRRHFGVQNEDPIPPFILVHVRRNDFAGSCPQGISRDECFAPVSAYKRRVEEIQQALLSRWDKVNATQVLVTSDERDPMWWNQVSALGPEWRWINHTIENTVERYGKWYPLVLDVVFQSMGSGFVGTSGSTMSGLARKRTQDWHHGPGIDVRWGTPGADNH